MVLRAAVMFRPSVSYRRDAFMAGLSRLGYITGERPFSDPKQGDVLVMWNRSVYEEHMARRYEGAGASLLIAENGYIGKDEEGHKLFALARKHHNGAGEWKIGTTTRWVQSMRGDWRASGDDLVLLPQRSIGESGVAMPRNWLASVQALLKKKTSRRVRVRPHPGASKSDPYDDLKNAWAAITWGSGAGIKAIYAGVPVFHQLKSWIGSPAAVCLDENTDIEKPFLGDRLLMFERLAWAQWSLKEIQSGDAFAWLLNK